MHDLHKACEVLPLAGSGTLGRVAGVVEGARFLRLGRREHLPTRREKNRETAGPVFQKFLRQTRARSGALEAPQ